MNSGDPCNTCNEPVSIRPRPDTPHHGEFICPAEHHNGWVPKPMDAGRALGFTLPIGKYQGKQLAIVEHRDPGYLDWLLAECTTCKGGFRRAVEYVVGMRAKREQEQRT